MNTDEDLDVSRTEYDKGYTLYGFNLATDHDQVLSQYWVRYVSIVEFQYLI